VSNDGADVTSGGRLFQTWGPATLHYDASANPDWPVDALCFLPLCPSVRPFVRYQTYEHDNVEKTWTDFMQIGKSGQPGKGMKR